LCQKAAIAEPVEQDPNRTPEGPARPILWCGAALLSTLLPFILNWGIVGVADFDQFATFNQIALWWHALGDRAVSWNPFMCGGSTLVGNPQVPLFHPNMPLYWLFGPVNGLGMSFLPWGVAGFWGMWKLGRVYGLRRRTATWVAAAWLVNGFFVGQLGSMHVLYSAFYLLPLLFVLNRAIARNGDFRALAAMPFMLVLPSLYNHHFLAYGFPFVVGHFVFEAWASRREPRLVPKVALYGLSVVLAVSMLSLFLLPNLSWNSEFPRFKAGEFEPPLSLIQMLFFPYPIIPFELQHDQFERYYTIGPVLFVLFLVGLRRRIFLRPGLGPLVALSLVAFLTAIGSLEPFDLPPIMPFDVLRQVVPVYRSIRVPSRFFINAMPAILLVTGIAWQQLLDEGRWSDARRRWILVGAMVPLLLFNFGYIQFSLFSEERGVDRPQPAEQAADFRWGPTGYTFEMTRILEPNVGILDCYEALEVPEAKGLLAEHGFLLSTDPSVEVQRLNWGEFVVRASAPTTVRFNFNHHRGWRVVQTDGSVQIVSENRKPFELALSEGSFARVQYKVPAWALGVKITLIALALALAFAAMCLFASRRSQAPSHRADFE
jgi:hypothetical protein